MVFEKPGRDDRLDSYECKHSGPALRSDLVGAGALELGVGLGALGDGVLRKLAGEHGGGAQVPSTAQTTTMIPQSFRGAFLALRLRTVVRGERASRSIVNRTTALWSIRRVASLILAGLGSKLVVA